MAESQIQNFNHLKIHSQFSICEGAIKIDDLKEISKEKKIRSLALCDTSNLCGALEFAEKISKVGTQPIIGTQINFKLDDTIGLLPLFALNEIGYKRIIELSSLSYLNNDGTSDPHLNFEELLKNNEGIASLASGKNKEDASNISKIMLKKVGLAKRLNHYPSQLSGGEKQRVSIARALINNPQIILADEPTGSLDIETAKGIFELLKNQIKPDRIIIFATHNRFFANKSDCLLEIVNGNIKTING